MSANAESYIVNENELLNKKEHQQVTQDDDGIPYGIRHVSSFRYR